MTSRRYLACLCGVALVQAVFLYSSFFINLNSTLSEWSAFGINWPLQLFHNFLNGRAFQSSLYAAPGGGIAVGFCGNPYAYVHSFVVHAHILPYLFAYLWAPWPTLAWLYGIIILWSLAGMTWLTVLILKRLSPEDYRPKVAFALAVLLGGGLLSILDQFAQFLLFIGPFMMAAYYFFLTRRRWLFVAMIAAIGLIGEDASMMAVTFTAYLYFFEPEDGGRSLAKTGAAFAVPYMLLVLLVIQPASRAELILVSATNMTNVFKQVFQLTPAVLAKNIKTMWALFTILPAFVMAGPVFGWPTRKQAWLAAGLAFVSTWPYWGENFARGGGHHVIPTFTSLYLALLRMLAYGKASGEWPRRSVPTAALAATAVFFLFSWRVQANNLPSAMKPSLYRLSGKAEKAAALEQSLKVEEKSNRATIAAARALPNKSFVYLVNNRTMGFLVDRSDVWQCSDSLQGRPAFEQTDYFLIQKDAVDLNCCFNPAWGHDLRTVLANADVHIDDLNCPMTPELLRLVRKSFASTHRVVQDDDHVLLLENRNPREFVSPPSTIGMGWTKNLFKKAVIAPPPVASKK